MGADYPSGLAEGRACNPVSSAIWWKRRDLNSRTELPIGGFQDRYLKPLGHASRNKNPHNLSIALSCQQTAIQPSSRLGGDIKDIAFNQRL